MNDDLPADLAKPRRSPNGSLVAGLVVGGALLLLDVVALAYAVTLW